MAKPASRKSGRTGGSSIFTGVLIGLIVGAILAVGVALWATGINPFKFGKPATAPAKSAAPAPTPPETAPSFDFYKVLPDNSSGALPSAVAPAAAPQYYLQAGAFQRAEEADNMKAQLALLGVEAVIQTSEVANMGMLHRVRVGPFSTMDEVSRTRSLLAQNKIPVTLVKEVPTQQEKP